MKPALEQRLAALETMSQAELRAEWQRVYGAACPNLSPALLRLGLTYRLQLNASGRRGRSVERQLTTGRVATPAIAPGTQLVRSWNGRTISVTAEEDGFVFDGRRYRSLSAIARQVTGAHWSGPRFFGLKGRG